MKKLLILPFLLLCVSCQSQEPQKHIYLAGWEAQFNGNAQCQKFMTTQVVDKATALDVWSSIELVFENDKLVKAYDYDEGMRTVRKLDTSEIGMPFQVLEPHRINVITRAKRSNSYLGGELPEDFTLPKFDFVAPFQYLGKLSKDDEVFDWLPFDLHLVAPIYLNIYEFYVDYSDPMAPKVLDVEGLRNTDNSYDDLKADSEIVYEQVYITTRPSTNFGLDMGHTGVPSWIQYPEIPTCPKSNNTMRFVMQLSSSDVVKTKRTNIKVTDDWYQQYFDTMNFWGDGDLYIFFDPESKVACFIIQNT